MAEFFTRWFTPSKSDGGAPIPQMQPMAMPEAPKVEDASSKAAEALKKKKLAMSKSKSIYTSPLGIGGEAEISKKSLLGQ